MDRDKAIRAAKLTLGGMLEKNRHTTAVSRADGQIAPSKYLPNVPRAVHGDGGKVEDAINALPHVGQNRNGVPPEEAVASPLPRMEYPYMSMTPAKSVYADPLRVAINKAHAGAKVEDVPMDKIVTDVGAIGKSKIRNPAEGVPFVERINGIHHLRDGNHRAAAAFLRGDKSIKALLADMDEAIKANGRSATERADGGEVDGITAYHASPENIVGQFRPSARDVGIHFAANPALAHNAAVKSLMGRPDMAERVSPKAFKINARPEQIVDIPAASNRFDFYEILEHLHGAGKIDSDTFNKTYDGLQDIEDRISHPDETMKAQNVLFSNALSKSNIKALRYMNKFDAGPTWKDMEEGRMTSSVTPDHSYIVTDPSAIQQQAITKADGGAANAPMFQGVHESLQNESGAPLDLYHGTTQSKEFEAFDNAKLGARDAGFYGRGHYLTPLRGNAEGYADPDEMGRGAVIGPLHAALKNPYVWDVSSETKSHSTLRDLQSMGIMREKNELNPWDNLQSHHIQPFMAEMQRRGHDGVVVKTDHGHLPNGISEVVAFDPKTIKHTEAEAFDPTDPRIRREDGGEVDEDGITAYHGSPHSFDKFDMSKVGTGVGAPSAFSEGLYFSENEKNAEHFKALGASPIIGGKKGRSAGLSDDAYESVWKFAHDQGKSGTLADVASDAESDLLARSKELPFSARRDYQNVIDELRSRGSEDVKLGANMYKVKINAHPSTFADWDTPISQQSEIVKNAFLDFPQHNTFRELYDSGKIREKDLLNRGVSGARFKANDGTNNYVVYDDKLVSILNKYEYGGTVTRATGGPVMGYVPAAPIQIRQLAVAPIVPRQQQRPAGGFSQSLGSLMDTVNELKNKPEEPTPSASSEGHTPSGMIPLPEQGYQPSGMYAPFQSAIDRMIAEAPGKISVASGYRTPERQQELWEAAAAKYPDPEVRDNWVARPGTSSHNYGLAADLSYADDEALKWAQENAARYGLNFRMDNEDWHIEPANVFDIRSAMTIPGYATGGSVSKALALTRGFTKDGKSAIGSLKPKGK